MPNDAPNQNQSAQTENPPETKKPTWELFQCYGTVEGACLERCGCGEHDVRLYRDDNIVHWRGKHWLAICAFKAAESELNNSVKETCTTQPVK